MQPAPPGRGVVPPLPLRFRPGRRPRRGGWGLWEPGRGSLRAGERSRRRPRGGTGRDWKREEGTGGRGLGPRGAGTPRSASNHESLGCLRPTRSRPPTPKLTSGCPSGSGGSNFSLASLLPAREEKTSSCGLTETRRAGVAPRPALPLRLR